MIRCAKCKREMDESEVTRKFTISQLYVCRNTTDCSRAERCQLCQHAFIMKGAS